VNIVKKHGFRSEGRGINKSDDMYRVMIDMSKHEYLLIEQWMARQDKGSHQAQTTNSVSPKCLCDFKLVNREHDVAMVFNVSKCPVHASALRA